MSNAFNKFTEKEMNILLKNMCIIIDTREKANEHVINYLESKKVKYRVMKLDTGDYSFFIESNEETKALGITRDLYFNSYAERKAGLDEITGNLQKDKMTAFENELRRSTEGRFILFVEDENFDKNLATGNYRSKYEPKSLRGRLDSFQAKYNFVIRPVERDMFPHVVYHYFYYQCKHFLKTGLN